MIKILHVVSSLNINAGMMSVIMNYYRNIDRSKIQFDFFYFEEMKETHQAEIEQLGGKVFFMPYRTFKPSDQREIRKFFQEHKGEYTIVHCHPIWSAEVVAHEAKKIGIQHIIQHSHSTKFSDKRISAYRNQLLMKFVGFFATDYIACSPEAAALFGKKIESSGKVYLLPNAIELSNYTYDKYLREKIREEFGFNEGNLVIGNVGRLCIQKNQSFLLDVFNDILKLYPDAKLLIVGEGPLREEIEQKIKELHISDSVVLTGKRRDIKAILSAIDLFVMPSLFEGAPVSAIEARTCGLPCVLSDVITKSIEMKGIRYTSLNNSPTEWAKECLEHYEALKLDDRHDITEIVKHGLDIKTEAIKLQEYYLNLE